MRRDKLQPLMRPAGQAGECFQRKLDAERTVERLTEVVQSIERKLIDGSWAVTSQDLEARQTELNDAQAAHAIANAEFSARGL